MLAAQAGESGCNYANAGTGAYAETLCWLNFSAAGSAITTEYVERDAGTDRTSCQWQWWNYSCTTTWRFDNVLGAQYGSVAATGTATSMMQNAARTASQDAAAADRDSQLPLVGGTRYGNLGATGFTPYPITVTLQGGYVLTAGVTISSDTAAGRAIAARAFPTYSGAFLGNRDFYTGVGGNPALYQTFNGGSKTTTITLSNVTLRSNGTKTTGFSVVVADAESTDSGESIVWSRQNGSNFSWLPNTPGGTNGAATMGNGCPQSYAPALASTSATAECRANSSSNKTGTPMLQVSPTSASESTSFNISATLSTGGGLQGTAFGIIIARAQATVQVADRIVGSTGTSLDGTSFGVTINGGSTSSTGATATGATTGGIPVLLNAEGSRVTFGAASPSGALAASYTPSWQCFKTDPNSTARTLWPATGSSSTPPPASGSFALLRAGQFAHCTVTYTPPYLTLVKQVQNGSTGASNVPADWTLSGTGTSSRASGSGAGVRTAVAIGTYTLAETGPTNPWVHGYRWTGLSCAANTGSTAVGSLTTTPGSTSGTIASGSMPIAPGNDVTCRFVNTAQAQTTLTLVKRIGLFGTAAPTDFTLTATAPSGALAGPSGTTGTATATGAVTPGATYRLSESGGPATYVQDGAWSCVNQRGGTVSASAGSVSVPVAEQVTCTVTNATARLTLLKKVVNDSGGMITPEQFALIATPADTPEVPGLAGFTVDGASAITSTNTREVRPGHPYALTEDMGEYAYLGQSIQVYTGLMDETGPTAAQLADDRNWQRTLTAAQAAAFSVKANEHAIVRFVNDDAPPMALPFTGGLGADSFIFGGAGFLLLGLLAAAFPLARTRFRSSRKVPLMNIHKPQNTHPSASIQEGTAAMASTKKSLPARIAAGFGAAAIATFAVLGGALPASAAANIDPNAQASITIHKHVQTGTPGTAGTGAATDPVAGAPIEGVQFSIREVTSLNVETNETWTTLRTLKADGVLADSATYPLGSTAGTDAWTVTTAANGTIAQSVPVGVYLVEELSAPAAAGVVIKAQPFLVVVPQAVEATSTWNYNVHVYPKNTVSSVVKNLEDFDQQGLGSNLTWDLDIAVPVASEGRELTSFSVEDVLDSRLSHDIAALDAVRVSVGTTALTRGTDFTVALTGQKLVLDFTATGIAALVANPDQRVVIEIDTTINSFVSRDSSGTISNTATVSVNGSEIPSNAASAYFGGIELQKNDDAGAALQGAVFEVLDSDRNVVAINGVTEFTSDTDGVVTIAGLRTSSAGSETYTVREKSAPAGYLLGATTEWTIEVPVGTDAAIEETVVNAQVPAYALPVTGGSGQAAFMIGGFGLLAGALGFMLIRRRKAQADA